MANKKITELDQVTSSLATDILPLVRNPSGSPLNKYITEDDFLGKIRMVITVGTDNADYICDGVADDVQIQAAIDFVTALGGGTVFIKKGTYSIAAQVIHKTKVKIWGEGKGLTVIKPIDNFFSATGLYKFWINSAGTTDIELKDITFDMNGNNQDAEVQGPTYSDLNRFNIIRCKFINPYSAVFMLTGASLITLNLNVNFYECDFIGTGQVMHTDVVDIGGGTNITIDKCYWYDSIATQTMASLCIIDNLIVRDSVFDGANHGATLRIGGCNGVVDGNLIKNSNENGIWINPWREVAPYRQTTNLKIINNDISGSLYNGIWTEIAGADFADDYWLRSVKIIGNEIHDNQRNGLLLWYHKGLDVSHNDIYNNSKESAGTYYGINCNTPGTTYPYGVYEADIQTNRLFDLQVSPTQTRGILLAQTVNARLLGNRVTTGAGNELVRSSDTGTKALFNLNIADI